MLVVEMVWMAPKKVNVVKNKKNNKFWGMVYMYDSDLYKRAVHAYVYYIFCIAASCEYLLVLL